jgi:hypothetical protein
MKPDPAIPRRSFLATSVTALGFPAIVQAQPPRLGQGDFRYQLVPGWGQLNRETPVKNCHGIVCSQEGQIVLLTDHTANNVIVYAPDGKLLTKWGTRFPGAHGLSIVKANGRETLFITDLATHRIEQTTLEGATLAAWSWPEPSGKYQTEKEYRPSWTLHLPDGGFIALDGYGKDYFIEYGPNGKLQRTFGGPEGGIAHWGPHGGMADTALDGSSSLLVAMSDQQYLLQMDLSGVERRRIPLPGGNPRQIRRFGDHYVCAHLADNWPKDRNSRGFLSILDRELRVVSNIAATGPEYDTTGNLRPMRAEGEIFTHPHDAVVSPDGSLYVAQFASGNTYPLKFERV